MSIAIPNIGEKRSEIRQLNANAVNRIAAGEVVERPASALKELVENALDADAKRIDVAYADGGKTLIRVGDDGHGIPPDQLKIALSRHATSKIDGSDLLNIHTFGFRGEALPSLGAVGRMSIRSRSHDQPGAMIAVEAGEVSAVRPAALNGGTIVELRDIFYATPARLKFMRSDRAEAQAINDVIKRLAMVAPYVSFVLRDVSGGSSGREVFRADAETGDMFDAMLGRLAKVLGREFAQNSLKIDAEREGLRLTGYAGLPTYSRGSATAQYLFVNGRPVRDKLLSGALRAAYFDFLHRGRHPAAALFVDCDPKLVDVNVHPAKSEVRFRDPGMARGLIVSGLRHALADAGHRASSTVADAALGAFRRQNDGPRIYQMDRPGGGFVQRPVDPPSPGFAEAPMSGRVEEFEQPTPPAADWPLGAARAQVHENYIIAQTEDGIVIVDQHAAHERLIYEKLKKQMAENNVASQALLIPEIVELSDSECARLLEITGQLAGFGLVIEPFGKGAVAVQQIPAILGQTDPRAMILDILDELSDHGESLNVQARIEAILSRVACHGSIRSGRRMQAEEMNALLRQMETTPHSGQCNHGRPTYVELKLNDIEKLFGRR